ncbi:hypothetical protein J132_06838 [Termitomyces sp. J132]|nr:hypothetical protein J132_06838 [Termitomyces sp. J132]
MSCADPDTIAPAPVDDTNNDVPAPADNPLKRKTPPTDDDDAEADPEGDMDPDADADAEAEAEAEQRSFMPGGEYESGRVSQRRTAKAVEVAEAKARKLGQLVHPPSSSSAHPHSPRRALRSLSADLELESEDERVDIPEDVYRRQCEREREREREHEHEREREREHERERDRASFHAAYKADGERDPEMAESGPFAITYLRSTTYEPADEMSVSALVAYLNAAVPVDKYEDFDTGEVVRVLGGLRERARVRLEGDLVWLV